jgi:protein-disulfide isomerase
MNDATEPAAASVKPPTPSPETITFKRSHFYIALAPMMFVCGLAAGYLIWGRAQAASGDAGALPGGEESGPARAVPAPAPEKQRVAVSADDDPSLGPQNAPITIVEFSDFECPYCVRFSRDTLVPLLETYPQQIRFVYRDFPLVNIHPNARPAAEAAQCAFAQGRFWEFHNGIFQNQSRMGEALYLELAAELGLDQAEFEQCVNSRRFADEVAADMNAARELGITGTPTFFINGRPLVGSQPLQAFVAIIEVELSAQ